MIHSRDNRGYLYQQPADYDNALVKQFITLFPISPMASLLRGYYAYLGISIFEGEDDEDQVEPLPDDDPFDTILVSIIIHAQ